MRSALRRDVERFEKEYAGVSVPFEDARACHQAYGEYLRTWLAFIPTFLAYDAAKAGSPAPGAPSLEELSRRTARAAKVWDATTKRMMSERQKLADKHGLLLE
ncbi:MAG: hypothetical protein ABI333_19710 [bacterium]